MNKIFIAFICFLCLNESYQLDCSSFTGETCGGHNTNYKLSCHQFSAGNECEEVEVDDGCMIDPSNKCVKSGEGNYICYDDSDPKKCKKITYDSGCKVTYPNCEKDTASTDITTTQDCFFSEDQKHCGKKEKKCDLYYQSDCGGLKGIYENNNKKQCIQLSPDAGQCLDIELDENCQVDENTKNCEARAGKTIDSKQKCDFNDEKTKCSVRDLKCEEYSSDSCANSEISTCHKVKNLNQCKLIPDNSYCEVDTNGDCKKKENAQLQDYQECSFDTLYTKCEPVNIACERITNLDHCSYGVVAEGYECKKIDGKTSSCSSVLISKECKIDNDGKCQITTPKNKNKCQFTDDSKTVCEFYEINSQCALSDSGVCSLEDETDTTHTCYNPEEDTTKCLYREKICMDYNLDATCEDIKSGTSKCSLTNGICTQYTVDNFCTVTGGKCQKVDGQTFQENEDCIFDVVNEGEINSCIKRTKTCTNYFDNTICSGPDYNNAGQTQCYKFTNEKKCKQVSIDTQCHVVNDNCVYYGEGTIPSNKKCDFNQDHSQCKIRDKTCSEYSNSECNSVVGCTSYENLCYKSATDNYCKLTNGNCDKKEENSITQYEKCDKTLNNEKTTVTCHKRDLLCSDISTNECNSFIPKQGSNYECYYNSDFSHCMKITSDGKCKVDKTKGDCVEVEGKLGQDEICDSDEKYDDDGKPYLTCFARKNQCSDFKDSNCGNFTPETKLCFNFNENPGSNYCQEVKIDSQCSINEENKCVGNGCSFDEGNKRCYYKNNNAGLLKLERFVLLALALIL